MLLFFIKISTFNWQERFRVVSYAQVLERHAQAQGECNSYIESMLLLVDSAIEFPLHEAEENMYSTCEFMIGLTWMVGW